MMMNLFTMFDPSSMDFNMSWNIFICPCLILFMSFKFLKKNKIMIFITMIMTSLKMELLSLLYPSCKKFSINLLSNIFILILILNLLALTPFTFTLTAHLSISFSLALSLWLSFMIFGWTKNFNYMMSHLVPTGTPFQLMNFMVIIEMISNLIRPITLSVRLSANMVAGHLLLSLLSSFCLSSKVMLTSLPILIILSILELGVAFIQAYVLMTLSALYSSEVH